MAKLSGARTPLLQLQIPLTNVVFSCRYFDTDRRFPASLVSWADGCKGVVLSIAISDSIKKEPLLTTVSCFLLIYWLPYWVVYLITPKPIFFPMLFKISTCCSPRLASVFGSLKLVLINQSLSKLQFEHPLIFSTQGRLFDQRINSAIFVAKYWLSLIHIWRCRRRG